MSRHRWLGRLWLPVLRLRERWQIRRAFKRTTATSGFGDASTWTQVLDWLEHDAFHFFWTSAVAGIIGNRMDAGGLLAKKRLLRKFRPGEAAPGDSPPRLPLERALAAATATAANAGYSARRVRLLAAVHTGDHAWQFAMRVSWSRTVLLVRIPDAAPDSGELTSIKRPLRPLRIE
ncbi:hypothetical protein ABZ914_03790 [Spirillospora sp. NPDC046719]